MTTFSDAWEAFTRLPSLVTGTVTRCDCDDCKTMRRRRNNATEARKAVEKRNETAD